MDGNDILLRIARSVVRGAMQTIMNQVRVVEDVVKAPLEALVKAVIGTYWTGDGANRFAEEMAGLVFPDIDKICQVTTRYHDTLTKAVDIMDQAEAKATQRASQLYDVFQKIYQ